MRFITTLAVAPLVSAFLAPAAFASKDTIPDDVDLDAEVSALAPHNFPALWNFEVEEDFAETPEIMAQIEEAFILAANEVHDSTDIKFFSANIKSVMHEHFSKDDFMMLGEEEEEEDDDVDAADPADNRRHLRVTRWRPRRPNIHVRPQNSRKDPMWRPNYKVNLNVGCNLCARHPDDDATAMLASPLDLGMQFYDLEQGRNIHLAWQRTFCRKLHNIKSLKNPSRCFIFFDLEHENPVDDADMTIVSQI